MNLFYSNHPQYIELIDEEYGPYQIFINSNFNFDEFDPDKPLIVLNYGLVCSNHHWRLQAPFYEKCGLQVILHDYRCHFESAKNISLKSCTFSRIANDIYSIVNLLNPNKLFMIGHSMGVNVTLEFAKRYQSLLTGIVLISGTIFPPQDIMFNSNLLFYLENIAKVAESYTPSLVKAIWSTSYKNPLAVLGIRQGGFNPKHVSREFVETYMKKISELPIDLFFQLLDEMEAHDIVKHLSKIKTPTLVIGGSNDQVVPNRIQYFIQKQMPNASLYIVRNGSHVPQADFPDLINMATYEFIERLKI